MKDNKLSKRAGAQSYFLDLCELLGADKPIVPDNYCFERGAKKTEISAAKRLNQLRENWLNPPEWVDAMPEVVPVAAASRHSVQADSYGGSNAVSAVTSPQAGQLFRAPIAYPNRIIPKLEFAKAIKERTLTNRYNNRHAREVQWPEDAHRTLDLAVTHAYGCDDYSPEMADEEILRWLLKLNLERAAK